jgi:hypothetical protein
MSEYPLEMIRFWELAEVGTPVADVPPELRPMRELAIDLSFVGITDTTKVQTGWTPAKTTKKKAHELRPGMVIRLRPEDTQQGYRIEWVNVQTHTVEVQGSGPPCTYPHGADVEVWDGPLPLPIYSQPNPRLQLLPEGKKALALHRLRAAGQGTPPKRTRKRRRQSGKKLAPLTPEQLEAVQLVGEHKGNMAAAARAAGKSRTAMQKLYDKAMSKLGKKAVDKIKTQALPLDKREQVDVPDPSAPDLNAPEE